MLIDLRPCQKWKNANGATTWDTRIAHRNNYTARGIVETRENEQAEKTGTEPTDAGADMPFQAVEP